MTPQPMNSTPILTAGAKADIQGFITSGFGHLPFSAYLLLEIRRFAAAQAWLGEILPQVTTAGSWRPADGGPKIRPRRTLNVAFTQAGLAALRLAESALDSFPLEFQEGMASPARSRSLGDTGGSAPEKWEFGGPNGPPIHVVLLLHAATRGELEEACDAQRERIERTGEGLIEATGLAQYAERPDHGKEPFGFLDGIGQPQIRGIKGEGVATGEFILGYPNEYGLVPPGPVVPADADPEKLLPLSRNPLHQKAAHRDLGLHGTFVVYRKLAQDVALFWQFLQRESERLNGSADPAFMRGLAAKMVGRWPNGAPLVLSPDAMEETFAGRDDFGYAQDPAGLACPVGSHIRRTHPRDHMRPAAPTESLHMTARHRLLRRGRPYGPPLFDLTVLDHTHDPAGLQAILDLKDDGRDRGTHFFCVNASLKGQFEFVQQSWVNNPRFNGLANERDPLVGDHDPGAADPGTFRVPGCPVGNRTSPLARFVTVRGGAYLFMPGLTTLRYLSVGGSTPAAAGAG